VNPYAFSEIFSRQASCRFFIYHEFFIGISAFHVELIDHRHIIFRFFENILCGIKVPDRRFLPEPDKLFGFPVFHD